MSQGRSRGDDSMEEARFGFWIVTEKTKTRLGLESGSAAGIQAALGHSVRI